METLENPPQASQVGRAGKFDILDAQREPKVRFEDLPKPTQLDPLPVAQTSPPAPLLGKERGDVSVTNDGVRSQSAHDSLQEMLNFLSKPAKKISAPPSPEHVQKIEELKTNYGILVH